MKRLGLLLLAGLVTLAAGPLCCPPRLVVRLARPPYPTPIPLATPAATAAPLLPRPLYFLSDQGGSRQVWRLEADGRTATPVTHEKGNVTSFDLGKGGGLAYATSDGRLCLLVAGQQEPVLAIDLHKRSTGTLLTWVRWSPNARRLAYLRHTPPERISPNSDMEEIWSNDGLWLYDLATGDEAQLLPNLCRTRLSPRQRLIDEAYWSPRGDALLVHIDAQDAGYYGLVDYSAPNILSAVDPQVAHTPLFGQVAWRPDGHSLLRSGAGEGANCSLAIVDRASSRVTTLFEAAESGVCTAFPCALPEGWIAFIMAQGNSQERFRAHLGRMVGGELLHEPAAAYEFERPLAVAWEPRRRGAVLELGSAGPAGSRQLLYIPFDGSPTVRLLPDHAHPEQPTWLPR